MELLVSCKKIACVLLWKDGGNLQTVFTAVSVHAPCGREGASESASTFASRVSAIHRAHVPILI